MLKKMFALLNFVRNKLQLIKMLKEFHYYDSICITAFKIFEEKELLKNCKEIWFW